MPPSPDDVARLVNALFTVASGLDRARRNIPDAAALAVLQIVGTVDRDEPGRGVRPSELAQVLGVHRSAITHHLHTLTGAGHVSLATDPNDRRSSIVSLTHSGRAETARLAAQGMARFASFVADWTPAEVNDLARLLEKFERSKTSAAQKSHTQKSRTERENNP
jgi:DNA-binding MarR family transcriptional regulator